MFFITEGFLCIKNLSPPQNRLFKMYIFIVPFECFSCCEDFVSKLYLSFSANYIVASGGRFIKQTERERERNAADNAFCMNKSLFIAQ